MTTKDKPSQSSSPSRKEWAISYTQSDVDTIREHIEQDQAAKRRVLFIAFVISTGALIGAVILLSSGYSLYAKGRSTIDRLTSENASLKSRADECNRQLDEVRGREARAAETRSEAEARLGKALPAAFDTSNGGRAGNLAQMIYELPDHAVQTANQPPNTLFHNWKVKTDAGLDIYTLVGGFVNGKWVIYSDLIKR
jgi:outer membrane murein-binding lipoprotein Lpp